MPCPWSVLFCVEAIEVFFFHSQNLRRALAKKWCTCKIHSQLEESGASHTVFQCSSIFINNCTTKSTTSCSVTAVQQRIERNPIIYLPTGTLHTHRSQSHNKVPQLTGNHTTQCMLFIPFVRVSIINFDQGGRISKQNKIIQYYTNDKTIIYLRCLKQLRWVEEQLFVHSNQSILYCSTVRRLFNPIRTIYEVIDFPFLYCGMQV